MYRICFALTVFVIAAALALPVSAAPDDGGRKTIVLIFPVKLTGLTLTDAQRAQIKDYLDTRLTMEGVYKVMPESQVKRDLGRAKVESYNECFDEACRIDLTKTVYADKSVSVEITAESKICRVTAKLYDIAQEATETAADVPTNCDFGAIKLAMVETARQLSGKSKAAMSRPAASGDNVFSVSALPAVPTVRQVGQATAETSGTGSWNDIDVAAYEAYDAALAKDKDGSVSPEDKIKAWESLGSKYTAFAAQASTRATEWRRYLAEKAEAERIERLRREQMEKDWSKLSRLLKLKVFTNERKKAWATAFVDAYGEDRASNPHFPDLVSYLAADGKARTKWVRIPGGTFQMGSNDGEGDEKPVHSVTVSTFEMAQTEVTVWQYRQCVQAGSCTVPGTGSNCNWGVSGREDHPVNCIDWKQASSYAKWVGGRLPTEAEWEYAARGAGRDQKYPWGNQAATCSYAVMDDGGNGCGKNSTWPVCSKTAGNTSHGLCDMAGNVWEWCNDRYGGYSGGSVTNPTGPSSGSLRVIRGGSWNYFARDVRAALRDYSDPGRRNGLVGLRPARSVR